MSDPEVGTERWVRAATEHFLDRRVPREAATAVHGKVYRFDVQKYLKSWDGVFAIRVQRFQIQT